jgi:hypothetical protein
MRKSRVSSGTGEKSEGRTVTGLVRIETMLKPDIQLCNALDVLVKFYICEFLMVANVIFQFYATDFFLNGQFSRIAWDGLYLEEHHSVLPILSECKIDLYVFFISGLEGSL